MGNETTRPSPSLIAFYDSYCDHDYPIDSIQTFHTLVKALADLIDKKSTKGAE